MTSPPRPNVTLAGRVLDRVDQREVAPLILEMANERLRSQQAVSIALDARIAQVCSLQFTAAALAGALAATQGQQAVAFLASLGAICFVGGGALCLIGARSEPFYAGGLPPAWWAGALDHRRLTFRNARSWAAQQLQHAIDENSAGDRRRAACLNNGLIAAFAGAALVAGAALLKALL